MASILDTLCGQVLKPGLYFCGAMHTLVYKVLKKLEYSCTNLFALGFTVSGLIHCSKNWRGNNTGVLFGGLVFWGLIWQKE